MSLRDEYERGINDPKAPKMPWWFRHGPLLFVVFAVLWVAGFVVLGVR